MDGTGAAPQPPDSRPRPLGDERAHYWLALGMAQTLGLDLQGEIEAGRFSHADWADIVHRCRGCDWAERCPGWMAARELAEQAPGACVNAARFEALRRPADTDVADVIDDRQAG